MASRIEIELTSKRSDEEWTWRAAGAKQPKGLVPASLLYSGAKVGDVCRAEADFEIDGITITQVSPPQSKRSEPENRIAVLGPQRKFEAVTSELAPRRAKGPGGKRPRRDDAPGGEGRPKGRGRDGRDSRDGNDRSGSTGARRPQTGERAAKPDRGERADRPGRDRADRNTRTGAPRSDRTDRPERRSRPESGAPRYKRLVPKEDHRQAVFDELAPEHQPIAEQVLRGGIRAVRQAIDTENEKAKQEGRPQLNSNALIAVAEELLPKLKAADWLDKAEAAKADVNEIGLRDLRAVVTGADAVARTEEARLLAAELRDALDRRTNEAREKWATDIAQALNEERVVRALNLSSRPPDAQTKFPPELQERLKAAAEDAMSPETAPDQWILLLDAVANSPIRRAVEPKGLPASPGDKLLTAAKQAAGRIPALAKQLGVTIPPPPARRTSRPPMPTQRATETSATGASATEKAAGEITDEETLSAAPESVVTPVPSETVAVARETPAAGKPVSENAGAVSDGPVHDQQAGNESE